MKTPFITITAAALLATARNTAPDYDATGIFEATTVTLSAETAGRILSFPVSEGDSVLAGQEIALIDTTLLALQQKQIASQRQSAESSSPDIAAQAAALRTQIAHQQHECERFGRLLADGAATQKQYDDARAQLSTLRGQLEALLSTLGKNRSSISDNAVALQYQAEQIGEQMARSVIHSPSRAQCLSSMPNRASMPHPGAPSASWPTSTTYTCAAISPRHSLPMSASGAK